MPGIKSLAIAKDHSDRDLECQAALSDAFAELADRAAECGWSDEEVAAALAAPADNRMLGLVEIAKLDLLLGDRSSA